MKTAVIFPGQGSQSVGMGVDLLNTPAAEYFERADKTLGFKLSDIMFNGPEESLKLTENTQPALLTHSAALWSLVRNKIKADYFAGHSLGEYTAVWAAGGFKFEDAVLAVHKRGKFMQEAVPEGLGGMAAVLGASFGAVLQAVNAVSTPDSVAETANFNSEGQIVVSGHIAALDRFTEYMVDKKLAKRVVRLPVSAPFHCSLMKPAAEKMEKLLKKMTIKPLHTPVVNNVDAGEEQTPDEVLDALIRQIAGTVQWVKSVENLKSLGVKTFIEVGAGSVLTTLIKKIDKNLETDNINTVASGQ